MNRSMKWVQLIPLLLFFLGVWVLRQSQNEVWMQVDRAKELWRKGDHRAAVDLYQSIYERYPDSRYTPEVLWELATIHSVQPAGAERAAHFFGRLAEEFPDHSLAAEARFRQAEIYQKDLDESNRAVQLWEQLLERELSREFRNRVLFQLGNAYFNMNEFQAARSHLSSILDRGEDAELVQRTRVLVATIDQIEQRYEDSVQLLEEVLRRPECSECRLQAQLGLIQSFEVLDDLPRALSIAESITSREFSAERKRSLIERLRKQAGK